MVIVSIPIAKYAHSKYSLAVSTAMATEAIAVAVIVKHAQSCNRMCSRSLPSMASRAEKRFRHRPLLTAPHQSLADRHSPFGVTHYLLWRHLLWL